MLPRRPLNVWNWISRNDFRRTALAALSLMLCAPLAVRSHAQQTVHTVDYASTLWNVSDGLPEDSVQALVEGKDGQLWIGTTGGLAKTGGSRIRTHHIGLDKSLETSSVSSLSILKDGSLWIGTEGGGLLHLVGRHATVFSKAAGLSNGFVRTIFEDSRHKVWVGTDKGLFNLEGGVLQRVNSGLFSDLTVRAIVEDRQGRLWFGGSKLLSLDRAGNLQQYELRDKNEDLHVTALLQAKNGRLWIGTSAGLARLEDGHILPVPEVRSRVRVLLQAVDATIWIGTMEDGLWLLKGTDFTRLQDHGMLPSKTILSLLQDRFGQIWIGTQGGLVRVEHSPVSLVPIPDASDHDAETVSGDRAGNLWVVTKKIYLVHGDKAFEQEHGLRNVHARNIYRAKDGALWIGTEGRGVYRIRGGEVEHFTAPTQLTSDSIRGFLESRRGELWVATDEGITVIAGRSTQKLTEASGLAYSSARGLFEDRDGIIWIGSDRGLSAWKDGHFIHNSLTTTLSQEKVWTILQDRMGVLWFGTREHGLYRYRNGSMDHYTTDQGLPANGIYKVLQDRNGTFWISGPNVIFSLQEEQMEASYSSTSPLNPVLYAIPSNGERMYGGIEPAGYLAADDTLWFPSNRGVAHIAVRSEQSPARAPAISEMTPDGLIPLRTFVKAPADVLSLSLHLGVVYLQPQEAVRIRYKLENLETKWNEARPDDTVTYTNLKAGRYRLRVQAVDLAVPGALAEAVMAIEKSPYYYQTSWFYTLCALAAALLGWLAYVFRLRQLRLRFDAVLEERMRLAREMHDTVIQSCTGLSAILEAMDSTTADEVAHQELLAYAQELTQTTIEQARQAVWAMRHGIEADIDLAAVVESIASLTRRDHAEVEVNVEAANPIPMETSMAQELIMVIRESVSNALQHSGTSRLTLRAQADERDVAIEIEDFGCGIADERLAVDGHYGIVGMQERMRRIGGKLELITRQQQGTKVRISVARVIVFRPAEAP